MPEQIVVSGRERRDLQAEMDALYEALETQGITLPEVAQKRRNQNSNKRLLT